jgi:hypothetical protein
MDTTDTPLREAIERLNERMRATGATANPVTGHTEDPEASVLALSGLEFPWEESFDLMDGFAAQVLAALNVVEPERYAECIRDALRQALAIGIMFERIRQERES